MGGPCKFDKSPRCGGGLCQPPAAGTVDDHRRATLLLARPPDPRIAHWAVDQLDQRFQLALAGVWLDLLAWHGDAEVEATLRSAYGRSGTELAVPGALDGLSAIRAALRERRGAAPTRLIARLQDALRRDMTADGLLQANVGPNAAAGSRAHPMAGSHALRAYVSTLTGISLADTILHPGSNARVALTIASVMPAPTINQRFSSLPFAAVR